MTPDIVHKIVSSVSARLGREAIYRKVKNKDEYYILDLAFSYFQKADRNRRNDYRSGYLYYKKNDTNYLLFVIAHAPIMASFFNKNFDYSEFKKIIIDTSKYRNENFMLCKRANKEEVIISKKINEFIDKLDEIEKVGLIKSIFTNPLNNKTGIGNVFAVGLGKGFNENDVGKIIDKSWSLFLWLYPSKPLFKRNASLNRSLQKIDRKCEIAKIKCLPKSIIKTVCSGQVEAAHIKPHKNGGSDKLENGVWLCSCHHRLTEGKLEGERGLNKFSVKYVSKHNTKQ
jgi:hypothetical protein